MTSVIGSRAINKSGTADTASLPPSIEAVFEFSPRAAE